MDNPSGFSISEQLETSKNGYDVGACNAATVKDSLNVADGVLSSITDNLQIIRELAHSMHQILQYTAVAY